MRERIKDAYVRARDYVKDLAVHTQVEIAAGAVAGAIIFGSIGHANETMRSIFQPISYSEYEQIEDKAKKEGRELNHLTWHYAGTNDFTAKIAEAYNGDSFLRAIVPELQRDWFSQKLEQAMDTTGRIYRRNLRDFAKIIPEHARGALRELSDLTSASQESNNLREAFRKTWDYDRDENGHFEPQPDNCTTDDKGHQSCTPVPPKWVCDSYDHTWEYHPSEGVIASRKLTAAKQRVSEIKHLKIEVPTKTNAWNEQVIGQSYRHMKKRNPTEGEMLEAARFFKTGSQYELNIGDAIVLWNQFTNQDTKTWQKYLSTAKTTHRNTGCYPVPGPVEFEFAQDIQRRFGSLIKHEQNITRGIRESITKAPALEQKIKEFFLKQNPAMKAHFPENDGSKIKSSVGRLSREVISESRELYKANIPKGNEDTHYRFEVLLAYTLLGSLLGGLAGLGADVLVEKYVAPRFRSFNNSWRR